MADETKKVVEIPEDLLVAMQKQLADATSKIAALEAVSIAEGAEKGQKDIRELESLEERFKVKEYTLRKITLVDEKGNQTQKIVVGWRGSAYSIWDKSGPNSVEVIMYDVYFLGESKDKPTSITAKTFFAGEKIKCREVAKNIKIEKHKTGEEIEVTQWDEKHGRVETGQIIDGYYSMAEGTISVQVPGYDDPVAVDIKYLNA